MMPLHRPLSDAERELVQVMIERGGPSAQVYLEQLEQAVVTRQCECGCASIDLRVPGAVTGAKAGRYVIGDYLYGPEELPFGAILFADDGVLSRLEVYSFTPEPAPLPAPEDLRPWSDFGITLEERNTEIAASLDVP